MVRITRDGREWERLAAGLERLKHHEIFLDRDDIQVAAGGRTGSGITYAELVRAIDVAEIEDPGALVKMRAQMLRRVQIVSGEGRVRDLLVTEFVLN